MRVQRKKHQKMRFPPALVFFFTIVIAAAAAYGSALIWQSVEESSLAAENLPVQSTDTSSTLPVSPLNSPPRTSSSSEASRDENSNNEQPSSVSGPDDDEAKPEAGQPPDDSQAVKVRSEYPGALKASGKTVDKSYFDDSIFFGDSISTGIPLYQVMPNAEVVAFTGINTQNVTTKAVIDTPAGRMTMLDAAKQYGDKKKVYIMLGGNSLSFNKETFIDGYRAFLTLVKEQYPNAVVYLQSMTPVTDYVGKTYPSVSNQIINEYNLAIMDMAADMGVYYLDVAAALVDENGKLPDEASPVDGMHFEPLYYHKWFDYLKTHTVEENK